VEGQGEGIAWRLIENEFQFHFQLAPAMFEEQ
jgi:hypothetical protein